MKLPQKPPSTAELLTQLSKNPESIGQTLGGVFDWDPSFLRYRHWDKLRRSEPTPPGVTHEQWWLALKMSRMGSSRFFGLTGVDDMAFTVNQPPEVQSLLSSIDRRLGTEANLFRTEPVTSVTREEFLLKALFDESITSSQIEGAVTTREEAQAMLAAKREPKNKHERMVANNYAAIRYIRENSAAPLTPEFLRDIHRLITAGTLDDPEQEGRFRRATDKPVTLQDEEGNIVFTPPSPEQLTERMAQLCTFANATPEGPAFLHPILRAILLHFRLAYEHPFVDGNGRTARALFYWSMLHAGYPLVEHISLSEVILRHSRQYYEAFLFAETDENDATYFVLNQLEMLDRAIEQLYEHISRKRRELGENAERLAHQPDLNHRQVQLLLHGMKNPGTAYTIAAHQGFHGVNSMTARRDLADLATRGLLIRGGKIGRSHTFVVPADLRSRLESAKLGKR